jgi:FRG domain
VANEHGDTASGDDREVAAALGDVTPVAPARETKIISSVADLLAAMRSNPAEEIVWYRGHRIASWTLLPSIARPPRSVDAELTVLKRFKQNAYPFLRSPPFTEWEWLFFLQHYGAPTRLLDWTDSPLIGLYFAVENGEDDACDGCVWALRPTRLNRIARLIPSHPLDVPLFGQDKELDNYLPSHVLLTPGMESNTPAAGIAPRQFERMVAQMGSFTIIHKDQTPLENLDGDHLERYLIPAASKAAIRVELQHLRVTRLTVFPELTNVALQAQEGLW